MGSEIWLYVSESSKEQFRYYFFKPIGTKVPIAYGHLRENLAVLILPYCWTTVFEVPFSRTELFIPKKEIFNELALRNSVAKEHFILNFDFDRAKSNLTIKSPIVLEYFDSSGQGMAELSNENGKKYPFVARGSEIFGFAKPFANCLTQYLLENSLGF